MNLTNKLKDPHVRITTAHILVILTVSINMFFYTTNETSLLIQGALIVAVWLHHRDDLRLKNTLSENSNRLKEDMDIFDRNVIVSESDLDGIITYVNEKFCDETGYAKEELIGRPHSIMRDPEQSKEFYNNLWKTIKRGETFHSDFKNIKKDGTFFWCDTTIIPIKQDSIITGYKAIRFDTTNKVIKEQDLQHDINQKDYLLQEQHKRFEFAINSSRDGFWDYDIENQKFFLSSGWKKRLGFEEKKDISYLEYLSLIPDEYRFEHHNSMHDLIETYPNKVQYVHFRIRYPITTINGERLTIEDVGDIFFNDNQAPMRITGFHRDITDQERQSKIIESQNRTSAMGEMIGNIAHQWRQPISAINNVLNDLEFDIELEDLKEIDAETFIQTSNKVKEYTKYLSNTIDDFRNISSNDKVKTDFYINTIMDEASVIVNKEYANNNIQLQVVQGYEGELEFHGYKRELVQVLINILNNSKDVCIEREVEVPKVIVTFTRQKENVTIIVHDNAGGVPDAILSKIFDPYFTTKHESIGTGIGLYMSKKMIMEHFNGDINVVNEDNGAKFTITLPMNSN